jgi:HEAT repeat protein
MRRLLIVLTAVVLTAVPLAALQEPASGGKTASQWIAELGSRKQKTRDGAVEALVAMGPAVVPDLIGALSHPEWLVQSGAATALGEIKDPRAAGPLLEAVKRGHSGNVAHDDALRALKMMGVVAAPALIGGLGDQRVSAVAADLLGAVRDEQTAAILVKMVGGENAVERGGAVRALAAMRDPSTVPPLMALLELQDTEVRSAAARVLGFIRDPAAVEPLVALLRGPSLDAAQAAANALGRIGGDPALSALDQVSQDPGLPGSIAAVEALRQWDIRGKPVRKADINALEITLIGTERLATWRGTSPPCKRTQPCAFFVVRLRLRALEGYRSLYGLVLGGDLRNARGKPQPLAGTGILDLKSPGDVQAVEYAFVVNPEDELKTFEMYGVSFDL